MKLYQVLSIASAAILLGTATLSNSASAQQQKAANTEKRVTVTNGDILAAKQSAGRAYHAMPTAFPGAKDKLAPINAQGATGAQLLKKDPNLAAETLFGSGQTPTPSGTHFYPADLVSNGGPTSTSATFHNIYVNMTSGTIATNWGNPKGFLTDLGFSSFIHLTDEYTHIFSPMERYNTDQMDYQVSYSTQNQVLVTDDLAAIVHAVIVNNGLGVGVNNIYNVYLTQGTDTCFDTTYSSCYSPDNYNTWRFCAYHTAYNFNDIGTVLFTAEPFQDVPGCAVQTPSPNGQLADSTNSVLSHEVFETITDPLPSSGWTNGTSLDLNGYEIGDECQPLGNNSGDFLAPTFYINGKPYEVQLEYSNRYHACAMQP